MMYCHHCGVKCGCFIEAFRVWNYQSGAEIYCEDCFRDTYISGPLSNVLTNTGTRPTPLTDTVRLLHLPHSISGLVSVSLRGLGEENAKD